MTPPHAHTGTYWLDAALCALSVYAIWAALVRLDNARADGWVGHSIGEK